MSKVYVTQEPIRRNPTTREFEPKFDLSPLTRLGELVILSSGRSPINAQPLVMRMMRDLREFCDDDYILPVGDPVAIGIACAVAAQMNQGKLKLLRWEREDGHRIVAVNVFGGPVAEPKPGEGT